MHNFQSRPPSGRRLSPWEDLSQAPTLDSPLEKLSVAQVRGAGGCSRLERVVGGGGPRREEVRQVVVGSQGHGEVEGSLISVDLGPGGGCPTEWKGVSPSPYQGDMINPENSLSVPLGSMHFEPLVAMASGAQGATSPSPLPLCLRNPRAAGRIRHRHGSPHPVSIKGVGGQMGGLPDGCHCHRGVTVLLWPLPSFLIP